jgi:hypothetical protein
MQIGLSYVFRGMQLILDIPRKFHNLVYTVLKLLTDHIQVFMNQMNSDLCSEKLAFSSMYWVIT